MSKERIISNIEYIDNNLTFLIEVEEIIRKDNEIIAREQIDGRLFPKGDFEKIKQFFTEHNINDDALLDFIESVWKPEAVVIHNSHFAN